MRTFFSEVFVFPLPLSLWRTVSYSFLPHPSLSFFPPLRPLFSHPVFSLLRQDMSQVESGEAVRCERELGLYLQDCEVLIRQLNLDLNILRDEKYYQVEQLACRSVEGEGV